MMVTGSHLFLSGISRPILTVTQLTGLVRTSIEGEFSDVWVEGEISNLRAPGSGHLYCTLKDESSQIRAVLFRSTAIRLRFALREGMHIVARGRLTVYEPRGEYQIVMEIVEPRGIGALQLAFEQLKERLATEGLFDPVRKKSLPSFPKSVGVVTSLSGAAIRDILAVLHRRWPTLHIVIVPVQVQGEGSGNQIAAALRCLNEEGQVEVIIVGRGGGSLEDLWSFNEEVVVRAVAGSRIPIVAAVGHETDVTLTDFAADVRAPTPSVAAEIVVPVLAEVVERLRNLSIRMRQVTARHCLSEHRRWGSGHRGLLRFRFRIQEEAQRIDQLTSRFDDGILSQLSKVRIRLRDGDRFLIRLSPIATVKRGLGMMHQIVKRLRRQMDVGAFQRRQQLQGSIAQLNGLSPLSILERGYSILSLSNGTVVKRTQDTRSGDEMTARLANGRLRCLVKRVIPDASV
jgi:exodeoxyribonuclease VII large subunit